MAIVTLGIDLAKNVFAVHGVDATGRAALVRSSIARAKLLELVAAFMAIDLSARDRVSVKLFPRET
jgi:hypothetical protein